MSNNRGIKSNVPAGFDRVLQRAAKAPPGHIQYIVQGHPNLGVKCSITEWMAEATRRYEPAVSLLAGRRVEPKRKPVLRRFAKRAPGKPLGGVDVDW
jgi:hypothetical protein